MKRIFQIASAVLAAALVCYFSIIPASHSLARIGVAWAQRPIELSCTAPATPFPGIGSVLNPSTGAERDWLCIDPTNGHVQINDGLGDGVQSVVTLSINCPTGSANCIQLPASGGCFNGTVTNGTSTLTFTSGFPPNIQVGMEAWVMSEHGGTSPCGSTDFKAVVSGTNLYNELNYCGAVGTSSPPVTVIAVDSVAGTVTLSANANCNTQSGLNSWLYYGFNILSQFRQACNFTTNFPNGSGGLQGPLIRVGAGFWVLDNIANAITNQAVCGANNVAQAAPAPVGIAGDSMDTTYFVTPPWYQHGGDTGTVFSGVPIMRDFTLDGTWTLLNVGINRGTPIDVSGCPRIDAIRIVGYNLGNTATAETIYYGAIGKGSACYIRGSVLSGGNRGMVATSGSKLATLAFIDDIISTQTTALLMSTVTSTGGLNQVLGGYYATGGANVESTCSVLGYAGGTGDQGDIWQISGATFENYGSCPVIQDLEASGSIHLSNSRLVATGTNAGGLQIGSGVVVRSQGSTIQANGTGYTVDNAGTFIDAGGNTISGGAGVHGAGSFYGNLPTVVTQLGTCNSTYAGWGANVTDATATTYLSTVAGGGTNKVHVQCNGTNWVIE